MLFERGVIHNRERAKQLRDYSGLLFGNITPTDIDGIIEYHGKGYIIIEVKWRGMPLSYGQRLALERLTDDLERGHKPTICLVAEHIINSPEEDIPVAGTLVTEYRYKGKWHDAVELKHTTADFAKWFIDNKLSGKTFSLP